MLSSFNGCVINCTKKLSNILALLVVSYNRTKTIKVTNPPYLKKYLYSSIVHIQSFRIRFI